MQNQVKISKSKNNKELKKLLQEVNQSMNLATTKDQAWAVFDKLIAYPYLIKYDFKISGIFVVLTFFSTLISVFFIEDQMPVNIAIMVISIIVFSIGLIFISYKIYYLDSIKKALIKKTMQILYKSKNLSSKLLDETLHRFSDFNRGSYSNELENGVEVEFNSYKGKMRIPVVILHYVNEHTSRDSKGNTRTHYTHHYRQGAIFPQVSSMKSILISQTRCSTNYQASFRPASRKFQRLFKSIKADSEFLLAKFLEPDVVLMLQDATKKLKSLTVEFTPAGDFLISKSGRDLLKADTIHSLEFPEKMRDELFTQTSYKNLDTLLALANSLIRQMQ